MVFTKKKKKKDTIYSKLQGQGQSHVRGQVNKDYRDKEVADKKNKTFIFLKKAEAPSNKHLPVGMIVDRMLLLALCETHEYIPDALTTGYKNTLLH